MNRRERGAQARESRQSPPSLSGAATTPTRPACPIAPHHHFNRGNAALAAGKYAVAVRRYRHALAIAPGEPEAWSNLGCAYWKMGRLDRAASCLERAIAIRPAYAEAHNNLGGVLEMRDRIEEAIAHYRTAVELKPDYAIAHCNLAGALLRAGHLSHAISHYVRAVQLKPDYADAHSNLGCVLQAGGHTEQAEACLRRALAIQPDHPKALSNLGDILRDQGRVDEAIETYRRVLRAEPGNWGVQVKRALTQPIVIASRESAVQLRTNVIASLAALARKNARLEDPHREVGMTNLYFAYHGMNDLELQSRIARFYLGVCPALGWTAPHCVEPRLTAATQRLKIAIVSSCLRDHTVGKFYHGVIAKLPRDRFEVIVFRPRHEDDVVAEAIDRAADRAIEIPRNLGPARQLIAAERPDIIFYPEVGMDPFIYFLAFARLAPVQSVSWGHPVTTGIPAIDYFLSAEDLEHPDAQAHYSERLIRLHRLPTYYARPHHPGVPARRAEFGIPEGGKLYLCPQSLFKLHPDFDVAMATLLRRDPESRLVLISGNHRHWNTMLARRIASAFPDVASRIVFSPRVARNQFSRLLTAADVLLDPPYFGGGNTTYEALALGLPIVTWPGPFMRGRVTAACYKQMGFYDLIASNMDEYVDLAIMLAHNDNRRARARKEIDRRVDALYEDTAAITGIERFFCAAWEANRRGVRLTDWEVAP